MAHVDAGKTSVTEQLLALSGTVRQAGSVDDGTARTDWLEVERRRGISVKTACASILWQGCRINLVDTPGHMDFAGEVERCLGVLDGVVLILSAVEGIQAQTEAIWKAVRRLGIPVLLLINKIDRAGADVSRLCKDIRQGFSADILPMQTVLDEGTDGCRVENRTMADGAFRETCWLTASRWDEKLESAYLEERPVTDEQLADSLRLGAGMGEIFPVFFSSAKMGVGMGELLQGIVDFLPPAGGSEEAPLSGLVFQVQNDPDMGKAAHVRLFDGCLRSREPVPVYGREDAEAEKITQIRRVTGGRAVDIGRLGCGDIGVLYGLSSIRTGDVLGRKPLQRAALAGDTRLAVPLLMVQVFPSEGEELAPLIKAMKELSEEEPLLDFCFVQETRELYAHITGTVQLETLAELLRDRYGLTAGFSAPTVLYKETPVRPGKGLERYTMPKPCWAVVELAMEPLPRGSGLQFRSVIKDNQLFSRYQHHVETSVFDTLKQGIYGWEVTDALVTLVGGEQHLVHTHPLDFFVATPIAALRALTDCGSTLLEPLVLVRLSAGEELLGRVIGDVLHMRGEFDSPVIKDGQFTLEAVLPVSSSLEYPIDFRSMSGGRGLYTSRFYGYKECPLELGMTLPRRGVDPLDRAKWILHARSALT